MNADVRIFPSRMRARMLYRLVPAWLTLCRRENAKRVLIDLSRVHNLDYSSFEILLMRLSEDLGARVEIHNAAPHIAHTLRCVDLLHGAGLVERQRSQPSRPGTA